MNGNPGDELVNARVIFVGVMLACINRNGQYEVGMVHCPRHSPTIRISQNGGPDKEISWPKDHDLGFKVTNPTSKGVTFHRTTNREFHFDRVIDLEGFLLHRRRVTVHPAPLQGRRLAFTAGRLYTHKLSDKDFDLLTWTDEKDPGTRRGHIGEIAQKVGLNIECLDRPGSGIDIIDIETGKVIFPMPTSKGKTYLITVENDCRKSRSKDKPETGTDFRFFYNQGFITSGDGLKFDLGIIKKGKTIRSPDACENTFLSITKTLGIKNTG